MEIKKSKEITALLESRNIRDEEVQQVVREAEETGEKKFYHSEIGRYLASKKIGEAVHWVLYSVEESGYVIHSAYWYKSELS